MMEIAVDSSVLVGLLVPNDLWHERAIALWKTIKAVGHTGLFFDCVVAETVSVAVRRMHEKGRAVEVASLLDRLDAQILLDTITWILPDVPRLYSQVLDLIRASSGELNFNDALIALACQERDIPAIASFDADFDRVNWLKRIAEPTDLSPSQ
jgi:predicted nucleic acid-binding protein